MIGEELVYNVSYASFDIGQFRVTIQAETLVNGKKNIRAVAHIDSYKGIPFAAPPVGELRWRPPQPAAKWTGVRQATEYGANCMQGRFGPPADRGRDTLCGTRRPFHCRFFPGRL